MAINDQLFDGDEEDDPFQALERDDDPIVWEANESLLREQFRQFVRRQDELERERIADFAEADDELLGLLQQFRYDDEGFLEKLDPELNVISGENDVLSEVELTHVDDESDDLDIDSPESLENDSSTYPFGEDDEDIETDETPEPSTDLPSIEFKVDVLERLAALRRSGDLTKNEFESLKADLLKRLN